MYLTVWPSKKSLVSFILRVRISNVLSRWSWTTGIFVGPHSAQSGSHGSSALIRGHIDGVTTLAECLESAVGLPCQPVLQPALELLLPDPVLAASVEELKIGHVEEVLAAGVVGADPFLDNERVTPLAVHSAS